MADPKPIDPEKLIATLFADIRKELRDGKGLTGTQKYQSVERLQEGLANLQANLPSLVDGTVRQLTYLKAQVDALLASPGNISPNNVTATTLAASGTGSVGGTLVVGGRLTANAGMTSTGVRNNQVTTGYVAMYADINGDFGYAPSTMSTKTLLRNFTVDLEAWLTLIPKVIAYKDDPAKAPQVALIAELLVKREPMLGIYDEAGKLRGIRYELLGVVCLALIQAHVAETRAYRDTTDARLRALEERTT